MLSYEIEGGKDFTMITGEITGKAVKGSINKLFIAATTNTPTKIAIGTIVSLIEFDVEDLVTFASKVLEIANSKEGE